jgi:hypothetical protein
MESKVRFTVRRTIYSKPHASCLRPAVRRLTVLATAPLRAVTGVLVTPPYGYRQSVYVQAAGYAPLP